MFKRTYPVTPPYLYKRDYLFLIKNLFYNNSLEDRVKLQFSQRLHRRYTIPTSSGRLALKAILLALSLPKNSEILIPAYTCIVVADAISSAGLKPQFVDIDRHTANVSLANFKRARTKFTKAIILTHMFGNMTEISEIIKWAKEEKLYIIEDACLALGSIFRGKPAGSFGDISFVSFNIGKHITAFGGAIIATDNNSIFQKINSMISQKEVIFPLRKKISWWFSILIGPLLFRPDIYRFTLNLPKIFPSLKSVQNPISIYKKEEIPFYPLLDSQISLIVSQLNRLDWIIKRRVFLYNIFSRSLKDLKSVKLFAIGTDCVPSLSHFSFLLNDTHKKESLMAQALQGGIRLGQVFDYVCPNTPSYRQKRKYPNSQYIAKSILNVPFYPDMPDREAELICYKLKALIANL